MATVCFQLLAVGKRPMLTCAPHVPPLNGKCGTVRTAHPDWIQLLSNQIHSPYAILWAHSCSNTKLSPNKSLVFTSFQEAACCTAEAGTTEYTPSKHDQQLYTVHTSHTTISTSHSACNQWAVSLYRRPASDVWAGAKHHRVALENGGLMVEARAMDRGYQARVHHYRDWSPAVY